MAETFKDHPFIAYLEDHKEDRAMLSALRHGLGQAPEHAPSMFQYVVPRLPSDVNYWREHVYYMIAALFGLHPQSNTNGNMGDHFATVKNLNPDSPAAERRFTALLASHPDDLDVQLRRAISLLKSKDVAVNWHQLMRDTLAWNNAERRANVQRRWANQFWW